MFEQLFDAALLESVVRAMVPILLAALGGMICERAGVFQIAMEGMMLAGAFAAVAGSYLAVYSGLGVLFGVAAGVLVSLMLAFGTVSRRGDPIVLGIALNLMALGLTGFLLPQIFGVRGTFRHERIDGLDRLPIPGLSD
ncbi:MAG: ABC transporter permease, partial [Acidimicrobiia bacterium]|nr:ABC transporter permease [Acidimicrobiia bacterium]